jgi:ABC-type nitrate/sulfonate/bicarbonate transport system substrate-binding protein
MTTRRGVLKGAAAATALAMPYVNRALAADTITAMSPFGFIPEFSDLFNAKSGGHYAKHGLDVTVLATHGVQSVQQLVAGRVQFIRNTFVDLVHGVSSQDLPLVAIGTLTQASAFFVISAASKPIETVQDLRGKTVGIQGQVGGASSTYLRLMCKHYGVNIDDLTMQVAGNSPGSFELIRQGRIDCFVGGPDTLQKLLRANVPAVGWSTDKYVKTPSQIYVTTRDMVASRPDVVARFMAAIRDSVNEMLTVPLPTIFEREAKEFEMDGLGNMDEAVAAEQSFFPLWLVEGKDNLLRNVPERWASGVSLMKENGLAGLAPPEAYYTNQFVDMRT